MERVVVYAALLVMVRPPQDRLPVDPGAKVDERRQILKFRVGITVAQVYSSHDTTEETVVFHHVVHLCFYLDAQSPEGIDNNGGYQVVSAELGFVWERSG